MYGSFVKINGTQAACSE